MTNNAEREAFEKWWTDRKGQGYVSFKRDKHGDYVAEFVRDAWDAWQVERSGFEPVAYRYRYFNTDHRVWHGWIIQSHKPMLLIGTYEVETLYSYHGADY